METKRNVSWIGKCVSHKITFTSTVNLPELFPPEPASSVVPDWYKDTQSYIGDGRKIPTGDGKTSGTIKRCMPVFDAMTSGYILKTPVDLFISQKEEGGDRYYEWPSLGLLDFHPVEQAPIHPHRNGHLSYPKFVNPWAIKTAPGYSCLFVQPFHRESKFTILPGVVDTDTYCSPVNFPFVLNDLSFEGLIPAGTPMAQVIPFKRDAFKMEIGGQKEMLEIDKVNWKLGSKIFDRYKYQFWSKKSYR